MTCVPLVVCSLLQVRVWVTPQGAILCCDMRFRDWFGVSGDSLVGKPCHSLGKEPEALST
jgi:hypothetical protein